MNITAGHPLDLLPQQWVGQRTAVLGESGSGKSNTVAVLVEELAPHMPVTIIDPEGEMWTLRERLNVLVAGRSENVDVEIQPHQAGAIARWSVENGQHVILDLFDYNDDEIEACATAYAEALFDACKAKRQPYLLFVEEADIFFPQPLPKVSIWKHVAKRGRKYGLGMVLATQRSQNVDKNVLTQCQIRVLHGVTHPRDMGVYKDLIPLPSKEVTEAVNALMPGQAVVVYKDNGTQIKRGVQMRLRHTTHDGATPTLDGTNDTTAPALASTIDTDTITALTALLAESAAPPTNPAIEERDARIAELEAANALLDSLVDDLQGQLKDWQAQTERLQERIETLKLIEIAPIEVRVQMDTPAQAAPVAIAVGETPTPTAPPRRQAANQPSLFQFEDKTSNSDTLQTRQRHAFGNWKKRLVNHRPSDLAVLWYLATHPTESLTTEDLAAPLGYNASTLRNNTPHKLCKGDAKLLIRERDGRTYRYRSCLRERLCSLFPDLDADALHNEVIRAIRPKP